MIPTYLMPLANHLWQSSLFAGGAALLAAMLRNHRATLRYWLWLAASAKFLIPFSLLIGLGSRIESPAVPVISPTRFSSIAADLSQPFSLPIPTPFLATVPNAPSYVPTLLFAVWFCGFAVNALCWLGSFLRMRSAVRVALPIKGYLKSISLMESAALIEPCVFGVFQPVLLLPKGIRERLTAEELETILLHELCHVRRSDNLAAAVHMTMETLFWFYPFPYWIGKRLMDERELACDEEVLRTIARPEVYAQGILAVCRFGLQPSPISAAGVAGSDLKERIERIVTYRPALRLDWRRKLLLTLAAVVSLGVPFLTGLFLVGAQAQVSDGPQTFEVASIHTNKTGARNSGFRRFQGGELNTTNITLKMLIAFAYDIAEDRILQGPVWLDSEKYDILAKPDRSGSKPPDNSMGLIRLRTQTLLADSFHLKLHKESRESKIYRLVVDKGGPKHLDPPKTTKQDLVNNGHHVMAQAASMDYFAKIFLTDQMGAPVINQTGIQGSFDFSMDWSPDDSAPRRPGDGPDRLAPVEPTGPSFLAALREQLGLKLEAGKGPVEFLIVEHAEKASEN